jgi:acetylornithine/succinyldiaminopimelate/putrescine aminotransferase
MAPFEKLMEIRSFAGNRQTTGLADDALKDLMAKFPSLTIAVTKAHSIWQCYSAQCSDWFKMDEQKLIDFLQENILNFYKPVAVNPYVPLAAEGPWLVTTHGAVIHDSGGYGMLGFGQNPTNILKAASADYVMANVMTASFTHRRFTDVLRREIGHTRTGTQRHPYSKFVCLNSGSEAMTVASRISDIQAKNMTDPEGKHSGRKIRFLSQKGSFHGRTERPAKVSHSSHKSYQVLASFREDTQLDIIEAGSAQQLREAYERASKEGIYYEALFLEPVMGEGNPGMSLTREFYDLARKLTKEHGTLLIIDSIQAGLRATGYLSLCDYPGFETCDPPDMETYSKALNAGQYPLSVLALNETASGLYKKGVYGNTMTANPRALEVAISVLESVTPELRSNIRERGKEFLKRFAELQREFPDVVTGYQGTGLLCSLALTENGYTVLGEKCVEKEMRLKGIGVIHGGKNALRFTPHFAITSPEIELIIQGIRQALEQGPIYR